MLGSLHPDLLACLAAISRSINKVRTSSSPQAGSLVTKMSSTDRRTLAQATESRPLAGVHCPGQFVRQFRETYPRVDAGAAAESGVARRGGPHRRQCFLKDSPDVPCSGLGSGSAAHFAVADRGRTAGIPY